MTTTTDTLRREVRNAQAAVRRAKTPEATAAANERLAAAQAALSAATTPEAPAETAERRGETDGLAFAAIYPELTGGNDQPFSLHRDGCKDVEKEHARRGGTVDRFTAPSVDDALGRIIDAELVDMGYGYDDVRVHNCVKKPRRTPEATTPNRDLDVRAAAPGDVLWYVQPGGERAICRVRVVRAGPRMVEVRRIYEDGGEETGRAWRGRRLDQQGEGRNPTAYSPLGGELFWRPQDALRWHAAAVEELAAAMIERAERWSQGDAARLRARADALENITPREAL